MTSVRNVVVHMQLFWCSSKTYYSDIVQLALCNVYYNTVLEAYFDANCRKNHLILQETELWIVGHIKKNIDVIPHNYYLLCCHIEFHRDSPLCVNVYPGVKMVYR